MQLDPILIGMVLLAALLHASWNALVKFSGDRFLMATFIQGVGTLAGLLVLVWVVPLPSAAAWPFVIASAIIHTFYHLTLINAYRFGDLSYVYPLARGIAPMMVALGAAFWAKEIPDTEGAAGILMVSAGILLIGFDKAARMKDGWLPMGLALLVGVFIASYSIVDGIGIRKTEAFSYIVWLNTLEGLPFYLWVALKRRADVVPFVRRNWRQALGAATMAKTAYGLVLFAFVSGALASVTALRETSVLFAAVIGATMLGERFGPKRWLAAAVIVAGVIAIQLSK